MTFSIKSIAIITALAFSTPAMANNWREIVAGNNLALGKEMAFAPIPLYRRTTDGTETRKLTDGTWKNENLPGSKSAVGWGYVNGQINMILDLGDEKNIGHVVARFFGGEQWPSVVLPRRIVVSLSGDGRTYHEAASLTKVTGGESELAKEKPDSYFYIPETGTSFTHPFVLNVQKKARYVALNVTPGVNNLFSDEIFVMESKTPEQCASLEGLPAVHFVSKGLEIRPKKEELVITTNTVTPNYVYVSDMRSPEAKKSAARVFIDLPPGIEVKTGWKGTAKRDENAKTNRWIVDNLWTPEKPDWQGMEGPLYFIAGKDAVFSENATATFSTDDADSAQNAVTTPVRFVEIPDVPELKELSVSLAWMIERDHAYLYPDFFKTWRRLGFNTVSTFPRYALSDEEREQLRQFADEARKEGYRIAFNESPFHVMEQTYAKEAEIFTQIGGERGKHLCPVYTGEFYRKEMKRVAENAKLVRPDIIFWDIELWYRSADESKRCSRCREAFEASGMKDWDTFMYTQGTRMLHDLFNSVKGSAPAGDSPLVGAYNLVADPRYYHNVFDFLQNYPDSLQFGMPVLYVRGDVQKVHETIRKNNIAMKNRDIIPWLTTGTYGEFPAYKVEQQILETVLNGAKGFTYYRFQDHDPMDFYHQVIALRLLAPYEQLLKNGGRLALEESNENLAYTAWGDDREALILLGNYRENSDPQSTGIRIIDRDIIELQDVKTGESINITDTLRLEANEQRLLRCKFL